MGELGYIPIENAKTIRPGKIEFVPDKVKLNKEISIAATKVLVIVYINNKKYSESKLWYNSSMFNLVDMIYEVFIPKIYREGDNNPSLLKTDNTEVEEYVYSDNNTENANLNIKFVVYKLEEKRL